MNTTQSEILAIIEDYLIKHPGIRFTQALFNLGINEFADKINPETQKFHLRDVYSDGDSKVLDRIKENI